MFHQPLCGNHLGEKMSLASSGTTINSLDDTQRRRHAFKCVKTVDLKYSHHRHKTPNTKIKKKGHKKYFRGDGFVSYLELY